MTVAYRNGTRDENVNPAWRLPEHVAEAAEQGRYTPGRGPWYCVRILPDHGPVTRRSLLDGGVSRWKVDNYYTAVADGVVVAREVAGNGEDTGAYPACIITRARAQHLNHPTCILGGWAAAAYHGLMYWADAAVVLLLSPTRSGGSDRTQRAASRPLRAAFRHLPAGFDPVRDTVTPDPRFPHLRVVSAAVALAQCLRSVLSAKHTWHVPAVAGLSDVEIRAVQLIDAVAQCTGVTRAQIIRACRGVVSVRRVRRLLALSVGGAESPRETLLRLFVRDLLPAGHRWETQVGVRYREVVGGGVRTKRTFFDLGCRTLRIGLYYDGAHHGGEAQTEKDFEQLQDLRDERWQVVRVNKTLMANPAKMLAQIGNAIARAEASADAEADTDTAAGEQGQGRGS